MSVRVAPGCLREIAETLGRYFEARGIAFHIDEQPANALHVGFRVDGRPAAVTVSFDANAFAAFERWDTDAQRAALRRLEDEFAEMMAKRGPSAYAGDIHINRF